MISYYLIALIPCAIGLVLFLKSREINFLEWLGGSAIAFAVAGIIHACTLGAMYGDTETWSGKVLKATHYPKWIEEYEETHTSTDADGNVTTWTTTEHRTHHKYWTLETDLHGEIEIEQPLYDEITKNFGNVITREKPYKDGFDSGDPYIYVAYNHTGYVYPVTRTKRWENRLKGSKTLFNFTDVPNGVKVYPYPLNADFMQSDRLCGLALGDFNLKEFDRLNTYLGPLKKVNIIICGWNSADNQLGLYQEALWKGGKKNDLVITYGRTGPTCSWCYVFSWCERQDVKRELETLFVNNHPSDELFPQIKRLVIGKYQLKDWSKFDYVTVSPPWWCYLILVIAMLITQGGFWFYAYANDINKDSGSGDTRYFGGRDWRFRRSSFKIPTIRF